jgi:hypothetical protein
MLSPASWCLFVVDERSLKPSHRMIGGLFVFDAKRGKHRAAEYACLKNPLLPRRTNQARGTSSPRWNSGWETPPDRRDRDCPTCGVGSTPGQFTALFATSPTSPPHFEYDVPPPSVAVLRSHGLVFVSCKSKRPIERWAVLCKDLGDDLLSHGLSHTTIGAAAFHFRVRDGIGWYHSAMVAKETVECRML